MVDSADPPNEDETQYNEFINQIIELDALEVKFVDEFKEKIDVQFKWDIVKYSGKDLQL